MSVEDKRDSLKSSFSKAKQNKTKKTMRRVNMIKIYIGFLFKGTVSKIAKHKGI
jgi:hypothetical protein